MNCNLFDGTVLSDRSKRMLYDAGLYSCEDDEDEVEVGLHVLCVYKFFYL